MTESDDQPPSGNRWEPAGATAPEASELHEAEAAPAATGTAAAAPPSRPTSWTRARPESPAARPPCCWLVSWAGSPSGGPPPATDGWPGRRSRAYRPASTRDGRGPQGGPGGGPVMGQPPDGGQVPDMPGQDDGAAGRRRNGQLRTHDRPRYRRRPRRPRRAPAGPRSTARCGSLPGRCSGSGCCSSPTGGWPTAACARGFAGGAAVLALGQLTGLVGQRAAAGPGAAHGPDPGARAGLRPGRPGPPAPAGRLHQLQPDARPHRRSSPSGTPAATCSPARDGSGT